MGQDLVDKNIKKILNKLIEKYNLNEREVEELKTATINYDYEANEGIVFTRVETIENLFTEENNERRIYPTVKQLKAMAEYIKETERYYMLYGYKEYTEDVINLILSKDEDEVTKLGLLQELKQVINQNLLKYSEDSILGKPKAEFEIEWKRENKKLILIEQMIREEKNKVRNKDKIL